MTNRQRHQYNNMLATLKQIAKGYEVEAVSVRQLAQYAIGGIKPVKTKTQ